MSVLITLEASVPGVEETFSGYLFNRGVSEWMSVNTRELMYEWLMVPPPGSAFDEQCFHLSSFCTC